LDSIRVEIGAAGWNPEQVAPAGTISTSSTASIAQVGDSSVIAAIGNDGSLWFYWQPIDATGWNPEQVAVPGSVIPG
jgi:hypothetical protein